MLKQLSIVSAILIATASFASTAEAGMGKKCRTGNWGKAPMSHGTTTPPVTPPVTPPAPASTSKPLDVTQTSSSTNTQDQLNINNGSGHCRRGCSGGSVTAGNQSIVSNTGNSVSGVTSGTIKQTADSSNTQIQTNISNGGTVTGGTQTINSSTGNSVTK
jgi:hypothetical protein